MNENGRTFDPAKPAFSLPQFSPLFREGVPIVVNAAMAAMLSDMILDTVDEQDHPSMYALGSQLATFVDNGSRFRDGRPRVNQRPNPRPSVEVTAPAGG